MAKFNDLIKTDPELAAGILQDSFIHIVNHFIPEIYLTKEEYRILVKIILAGEAKEPDDTNGKPITKEDPEDPPKESGDDNQDKPSGEEPKDPGTTGGGEEPKNPSVGEGEVTPGEDEW